MNSKSFDILKILIESWNDIKNQMDYRTEGWILMKSILIPIGICTLYLLFILIKIPSEFWNFQSNQHKPISSKSNISKDDGKLDWKRKSLQFYNLFNVIMNLFLALGLTWIAIKGRYSFLCEKVQRDFKDEYKYLAPYFVYMFHISKIIELADTGFIILREKWRQLSFLHVYHHTTIVFATWIGARFVPDGTTVIISLINCWIHVIMYGYYKSKTSDASSSSFLNSPTQNVQICKRFITMLQILQFVITICICLMTLQMNCGYPIWVATSLILYMLTFVLLFVHFYISNYS